MNRLIALALLSTASAVPAFAAVGPCDMRDLGTLGSGWADVLQTTEILNSAGQVAGWSGTTSGVAHAVVWDPADGNKSDVGVDGYPNALNSTGEIVGYYITSTGHRHGFYWDAMTGFQDISSPSNGEIFMFAIKDSGVALGEDRQAGARRSFTYTKSNGLTYVETLGANASVYDMNDEGQMIGESTTEAGVRHAAYWDPAHGIRSLAETRSVYGVINNLGQVAFSRRVSGLNEAWFWDPVSGDTSSSVRIPTRAGADAVPYAINAIGHVAGTECDQLGKCEAFVWDGTAVTYLGTLGGNFSDVYDMNDAGQIVGIWRNLSNHTRAFLWDSANKMRDLGTLGGTEAEAFAINANGHVAGRTLTGTGERRAFVCLPWTAATAGGALSETVAQVLDEATAADGVEQAINGTVAVVQKKLNEGNLRAAGNILRALNNQTAAFVVAGKLSAESGAEIEAASTQVQQTIAAQSP